MPVSQSVKGREASFELVSSMGLKHLLVAITFLVGCASRQPHWEDFRGGGFEQLRSDYECAVELGYESPIPDECLKASWTAMRSMEQHQSCSADADCAVVHSWPPIGPCCTAVGHAWLLGQDAINLEKEVEKVCGSVHRICVKTTSCESRCVRGECALRVPEPYFIPANAPCVAR
jgi:hypothetical protein